MIKKREFHQTSLAKQLHPSNIVHRWHNQSSAITRADDGHGHVLLQVNFDPGFEYLGLIFALKLTKLKISIDSFILHDITYTVVSQKRTQYQISAHPKGLQFTPKSAHPIDLMQKINAT